MAGPRHEEAPAAQLVRKRRSIRESDRLTEAIKLRLSTADALALRVAARANARSVSAHVARLLVVNGDPAATAREADPLADASEIAAALAQTPNEIRRLRSQLASLGGLVKSLFIRPETIAQAKEHAQETGAALHALTLAAESATPVIARVEDELATIRVQLEQLVLRLAHDR